MSFSWGRCRQTRHSAQPARSGRIRTLQRTHRAAPSRPRDLEPPALALREPTAEIPKEESFGDKGKLDLAQHVGATSFNAGERRGAGGPTGERSGTDGEIERAGGAFHPVKDTELAEPHRAPSE